jgi:hypothetical protein
MKHSIIKVIQSIIRAGHDATCLYRLLRQEDREFEANLDNIVSSGLHCKVLPKKTKPKIKIKIPNKQNPARVAQHLYQGIF